MRHAEGHYDGTHNEEKFERAPGQGDVFGMMLDHYVEDVAIVHKLFR